MIYFRQAIHRSHANLSWSKISDFLDRMRFRDEALVVLLWFRILTMN